MGSVRFSTTLQKRGPAAAVVLDDEQVQRIGDTVDVAIELDTAPREVEVPEALASALAAEPAARAAFDALSYTHRKEYARAVADAKKPETRDRRVAETLEKLRTMP
jgi:uncharacterized protein YdeI (YjbR/CyaY-like superfamily)